MTDKNGITIEAGQYIQVIHAEVKNDNGIYIVEKQYKEDFLLNVDSCLDDDRLPGRLVGLGQSLHRLDQPY